MTAGGRELLNRPRMHDGRELEQRGLSFTRVSVERQRSLVVLADGLAERGSGAPTGPAADTLVYRRLPRALVRARLCAYGRAGHARRALARGWRYARHRLVECSGHHAAGATESRRARRRAAPVDARFRRSNASLTPPTPPPPPPPPPTLPPGTPRMRRTTLRPTAIARRRRGCCTSTAWTLC